ncbi:unnamed protein product [Darwinula stevensoni]|uniref:BEN domain-containing protein n=1 Tax=Darwinula stevensoni TaxID=69355 RepID=A0A7R8X530_9CRUS|nr:unnamed protein product [Darwinula stevensoni]CAG0885594.1 unnamed protein product [Darwinula stevensoni]
MSGLRGPYYKWLRDMTEGKTSKVPYTTKRRNELKRRKSQKERDRINWPEHHIEDSKIILPIHQPINTCEETGPSGQTEQFSDGGNEAHPEIDSCDFNDEGIQFHNAYDTLEEMEEEPYQEKSKFQCVIHWTESNQVSIVPLDCVVDEEMINDPEREGLIYHGAVGGHPPEGGWAKYPGKVLLCSDNKAEIKRKLDSAAARIDRVRHKQEQARRDKRMQKELTETLSIPQTQGKDNINMIGKGGGLKRKRSGDDMAKDVLQKSAKYTNALKLQESDFKTWNQIECVKSDDDDDDDDATIQKIICENQRLKKESDTLKKELHQQRELVSTFSGSNERLLKEVAILRDANLQLQEKLPSFTCKLEALVNSCLAASNHASPGQRQNVIAGSSALSMPGSPCNLPGQALMQPSTPPEGEARVEEDKAYVELVSELNEYTPPQEFMEEMAAETHWEKCVLKMMAGLFTPDELRRCTPKGGNGREALDQKKMKFIEGYVCKRFLVSKAVVTLKARQKCKDARQGMKKKKVQRESQDESEGRSHRNILC